MPKKILTIDDDPYIVKYITEVLSDNGYATCSASSVEEALSVLEAERPDLVTLDMEMPDEWGPRFYRKMSMNPAFKDTPVIVISGLQGTAKFCQLLQRCVCHIRSPPWDLRPHRRCPPGRSYHSGT